jgi:mannose-6-phosphate isomerase-like protein (cupin superfamily)
MESGWRVSRFDEMGPAWAGVDWETLQARMREQDPAALARWEQAAQDYPESDRTTHSVRRHFGIASFGASVYRASAGSPLIVPHDETQYGQEELLTLLDGRARFVCDGEEGELGVGDFLHVQPKVHRELFALETPTTVYIVGGVPGRAYSPPSWAPDWRPSG